MSANIKPETVTIRLMRDQDVQGIVEIEQEGYDFPWSAGIFHDCLRASYQCLVAVDDGEVIGYAVFSCAVGEAHILNLCIHPQWRGTGVAATLLSQLFNSAVKLGCRDVFLEVRPSNDSAMRLYQRFGFRTIGTRPDYYRALNGREDALVLTATLGPTGESTVFADLPVGETRYRH